MSDLSKYVRLLLVRLPALILSWSIFFILLSSCALNMGMSENIDGPVNSCSIDDDCANPDSACDRERSICVAKNAGESNFLVEVIPADSTSGSSPSQYFLYDGVAKREEVDQPFVLAEYVELKGVVKWTEIGANYVQGRSEEEAMCETPMQDDLGNCLVQAKLELSPLGDFPESLRPMTTVVTGVAPAEDGGYVLDFSIVTVPGPYTLRVVPQFPFDYYLPPVRFKDPANLSARMDIAGSQTFIIGYQPIGSLSNRVLDGVARRTDGARLSNVSIWAADSSTGERISSIARIDASSDAWPEGVDPSNPDAGTDSRFFRLYIAPMDEEAGAGNDFYIAISSDEEVPTIPTIKLGPYDFSLLDLYNAPGGVLDSEDNYANFDAAAVPSESQLILPTIGVQVGYFASVEGALDGGDSLPLEGIKVRFYTDDIGEDSTIGSYELLAATDPEGKIVAANGSQPVWLIPGWYTVSLYPPLGSDYEASRVTSVLIDGEQMGQVFMLQRKNLLDGLVLKEGGDETLADVTLEAYPLSPADSPTGTTVIPRYNSTWSDADGLFSIPLDTGVYNMVFMPSPASRLPWVWLDGVDVSELLQYYGSAARLWTISIPDPIVFEGRVLDPAGAALEDAEVKLYRVVYSPMDEPPQVRQIAKTSTEPDGGFAAFITLSGGSVSVH